MRISTKLCRFGVPTIVKFVGGAGKAAFMSVTDVMVAAVMMDVDGRQVNDGFLGKGSILVYYSASSVGDY